MAQAYELVNAYGCGSCLAFLDTYLGPADTVASEAASDSDASSDDERAARRPAPRGQAKSGAHGKAKAAGSKKGGGRGGGRKEDGRMVQQERTALFASGESDTVGQCRTRTGRRAAPNPDHLHTPSLPTDPSQASLNRWLGFCNALRAESRTRSFRRRCVCWRSTLRRTESARV